MSPSPKVSHVELHIPDAETEQEFLRLAVHAAIRKYRETRKISINPPRATRDEGYSPQATVS